MDWCYNPQLLANNVMCALCTILHSVEINLCNFQFLQHQCLANSPQLKVSCPEEIFLEMRNFTEN